MAERGVGPGLGSTARSLGACEGGAREPIFGNRIFVRGVIEVGNFCRQNCMYCGMRRENGDLRRFRLAREAVRRLLEERLPASVTDLNFQAGEDPVVLREVVLPVIEDLAKESRLGISLCMGTLAFRLYDAAKRAGARGYILKLETGDARHYRLLQRPGTLESRIEAIRYPAETGWRVSFGWIHGLPQQTPAQEAETLDLLCSLPLSGCGVSPLTAISHKFRSRGAANGLGCEAGAGFPPELYEDILRGWKTKRERSRRARFASRRRKLVRNGRSYPGRVLRSLPNRRETSTARSTPWRFFGSPRRTG
ncbi:protein of unknown function [Methylacidimicrobium sp. AP8]|uniref:radical SAM protein n=1 Tax=Methylacidimicrobium sp. AP8 TaxID=2730359 RepID=UPI0018C02669|nr:radical SAM protein [Methylacidimicrobium sp. AP8]CAB4243464.1 protein of unknown function [Methylacidimicrobium sp. AP8]